MGKTSRRKDVSDKFMNVLRGIHDSGCQNQLASGLSVLNLRGSQACNVRVVRPIEQNNVHKSHAR